MGLTARDLMRTGVVCVRPEMPLGELEEVLLRERIHGAPVEDGGRVVGIVSRSDVVRQLELERERFEASSFYLEPFDADERSNGETARVWEAAGARLGRLAVKDVMTREVVAVRPDAPLQEVARVMLERRVHRLLVMEDGRLLGLVSSTDLISVLAEGRED
jgi:CBS domain-containing protein